MSTRTVMAVFLRQSFYPTRSLPVKPWLEPSEPGRAGPVGFRVQSRARVGAARVKRRERRGDTRGL